MLKRSDIKLLVKNYFGRNGLLIKCFGDNMPDNSWYCRFIERHHQLLTTTLSENIERSRIEMSYAALEDKFNNLDTILENIPSENFVNYDEIKILERGKSLCNGISYIRRR